MIWLNIIVVVLVAWSMFGLIHFWCGPAPKGKVMILLNALLSGPFVWALMLCTAGVMLRWRQDNDFGDFNE